jgi:hypothetical protein
VIEAEKASYPIKRMCELLEVSRSGYYKWRTSRDRGPTPAPRRRAELDAKVAKFHAASDGVYGTPRILADLRADGERVSGKTVAASLRRQGLAGICPRRFAPATTVVDLDGRGAQRPGGAPFRHRGAQPGVDQRLLMPTSALDVLCRPSEYADSSWDGVLLCRFRG